MSPWLVKYGGSALWAAMVYWIIAAALPGRPAIQLAGIAGTIATLVEVTRLYHTPAFDAFRRTLTGRLLLGSHFSVKDIAAYWVAIALTAAIDIATSRKAQI